MAAKKQAAKAGAAMAAVRESPYVQKLVEDEDLRQNIWTAYESSRNAYARLTNGKSPSTALFEDKKLQKELQTAASALRDASVTIREAPKKSKSRGGGLGKKLLLVLVAGGVALALSEGLRKKVLDALFGAEEEFEYTSPTTSSSSSASSSPAGAPA